ncbi:unnamed protein product [Orchesella dallaii]|uniref:Uncharacterized protein n=1 Tax=Orchesella dallaii TaxID=48710 RepID=A0ABP1R2G3_9HEXA
MGSVGFHTFFGAWLLLLTSLLAVEALQSLKDVEEGPCDGVQYKAQENANITWLTSVQLPYLLAGSKYHLYRFIKYHHNVPLKEVQEYQFYYDSCFRSYANVSTGEAVIFGFNGEMSSRYLIKPTTEHGVLDFVPTASNIGEEISRHHITLTDNKSFALFANCWMGPHQRSWDLISTEDSLSPETKKMIEEHLMSLGFDRKQFVFFNNNSCGKFMPTL